MTTSLNSVPKAKFLSLLMFWRFPKPPPGLVIQYKDSEDSAYSCTHGYNLLQQKLQSEISISFQKYPCSGITQDQFNSSSVGL